MSLIAALFGFVSLISNQTQNGALKKKRDHHHGSEEMAVAYCQGHGRLVSCFLPDDNDGGSLQKKGGVYTGGGERGKIKPPTPCLWQAPASAQNSFLLSDELATYLPLL